MKVPFAQADIGDAEIRAVTDVLKSGWLTSGQVMHELEGRLENYMGEPHEKVQAIACSSATAGLHMALEACGVGVGDRVLVPTMTFTATAEVVRYLDAFPVFVDVNPETGNIDMKHAETVVTPRCKAIIPVHFGGVPCEMAEIWAFAKKHSLKVIEDAAHALGSSYNGHKIGVGLSDAVVFSFYATKTMTTAEGGMVCTQKPHIAERMKKMRLHGIDRDAFARYTSEVPEWEYDVIAAGFKYNMPDVLAAIGVEQLKRLDQMQNKRKSIAVFYNEALGNQVKLPYWSSDSSYHLYVLRVPERNRFIERMYRCGVGCSVHFKPLHQMTYWKQYSRGLYTGANQMFAECVSLPIYSKMTPEMILHTVEAVKSCVQ